MKKNKKPMTLKRLFLDYLKVFAGILVVVMMFVYVYLQDYQKNLSSELGNRVIAALETLDMKTLDELSSNLPSSMMNPDIFSQYLKSFGEETDLYFYAGTSKVENQQVYIIGNHDKMMATLIVEKTGKKSFFGFEKFKEVDLVFKPLHEIKIISTSKVPLLVNGVSIDEQVQELKTSQITAFSQAAFGLIETSTYSFKNFQYIGSVTVADAPNVEVTYDPVKFTYSVVTRPSQAIQDEIKSFGIAAMKAHTRLLSVPGLSRYKFIKDYIYPGSHFEEMVNGYELFLYPLISESFENEKTSNFIQYGANAYSADISMTYHLTSTWVGVVRTRDMYPFYRVYVTKINGKWQVTDIAILAATT